MTSRRKTPIESSKDIRLRSKDLVETSESILAITSQLLERARKLVPTVRKKTHKQAIAMKRAG
ncbi:MAG: hypothetical protein JWO13_21 [Acidobacteriales bacterium]|nr:hypothetical protein [Terriglobales bacterium]